MERIQQLEEQVASLGIRASLNARKRDRRLKSETPVVVNQTTTGSSLTFISPVTIFTAEVGAIAWTAYDASASIPEEATAVLLESEWAMQGPDLPGVVDAYIRIRSGTDEYVLSRGRAGGALDANGGSNQGVFPCSGQSFEYEIELGFDNECSLKLIGYWS